MTSPPLGISIPQLLSVPGFLVEYPLIIVLDPQRCVTCQELLRIAAGRGVVVVQLPVPMRTVAMLYNVQLVHVIQF